MLTPGGRQEPISLACDSPCSFLWHSLPKVPSGTRVIGCKHFLKQPCLECHVLSSSGLPTGIPGQCWQGEESFNLGPTRPLLCPYPERGSRMWKSIGKEHLMLFSGVVQREASARARTSDPSVAQEVTGGGGPCVMRVTTNGPGLFLRIKTPQRKLNLHREGSGVVLLAGHLAGSPFSALWIPHRKVQVTVSPPALPGPRPMRSCKYKYPAAGALPASEGSSCTLGHQSSKDRKKAREKS